MRSFQAAPVSGQEARAGLLAALATYGLWGMLPLYFKLLDHLDPVAIIAARVVISMLLVGAIVVLSGRWGEVRAALGRPRTMMAMTASAVLVSINWLVFVWAVAQERILEVSFGYFINPLVSVAIGTLLLSERLGRGQMVAIAIALVAVGVQAVALGVVPWVALALALSFAFYGYVRKRVAIGAAAGLFVETLVLMPPSVLYMAYLLLGPQPDFFADAGTNVLLLLTGPATAVPLIMFAFAARRLPLSLIGMLQYLAPSMQFLFAVFLLGETLTAAGLVSFALIWLSLAVFSLDLLRRRSG